MGQRLAQDNAQAPRAAALEGLRDAIVATGGAWARVPVLVCSRDSAA